ncbi:pectin lyase fold [Lucifera butyrica]|uniref:Pectin lyase fold n=1 Tax=Lucifera butyrica TaxID=1351585 RepID=A0A498RFW8_9FIRM|nr:hemagglutinin repeat-containing protein [Lucifera butyrica]VBB09905.1 pectin lyase fold [Lucifera butyrica]
MKYKYGKWSKKFISWVLLILFITQPALAAAQVVADPNAPGQNKPKIDTTANGLPVVLIASPSSAGVSHNRYLQFDVDPGGLILNNSAGVTKTQLAGYVNGNSYIVGNGARIILNEVTGANTSQLRGYLEVAGPRAEVIIANRNGIIGNGFGFINTSRAILTTGTPVFGGSGSLDAFRVTGGQIAIQGAGMDASTTDRADIISRAVAVNAGVWGHELNVVTGANQVSHTDLSTQKIAGSGETPKVSLDVAALGGMYADKIKLVGTEAGVGVNSAGTLSAHSGDLTLNQEGKIVLSGSNSAAGNIQITANDSVTQQGVTYAAGNTNVTALDINNSGVLAAQNNTAIAAQSVASTGTLGAGIQGDGTVGGSGDLSIAATDAVHANGKNLAAGTLTASGSTVDLSGATTYAGGSAIFTATTGDLNNTGGYLQSGGALAVNAAGTVTNDRDGNGNAGQIIAGKVTIAAGNLSNKGGSIRQTGSDMTGLTAVNILDNTGGVIASNGSSFLLQAGSVTNNQGQIQHAGTGALTLQTSGLQNVTGLISSNGQANIQAQTMDNSGGGIGAGQDLNITLSGDLTNGAGGQMQAGHNLNLSATGSNSRLNNQGILYAQGNTNLNTAGTLTNSGVLAAAQNTAITAHTLSSSATGTLGAGINGDGTVGNSGNLTVTATDAVAANGKNLAGGNLAVTGTAADLSGATTYAKGTATVTATGGDVNHTGGNMQVIGALTVNAAGTVTNDRDASGNAGRITAGQLTIAANQISNKGGVLKQTGTDATGLTAAGVIDNTGGYLGTNGSSLTLQSGTVTNTQGQIIHTGTGPLEIQINADLNNNGGSIESNGVIHIPQVRNMDNTGGTVSAGKDLVINPDNDFTNGAGGLLHANGNFTLATAGAVTNAGGITAGQTANLTGSQVTNDIHASAAAGNALNVSTAGNVVNNGSMQGNTISLTGQTVTNNGSVIGGAITVQAGQIVNQGTNATIAATGDINLYGRSAVTNQSSATIYSRGNLTIAGSGSQAANGQPDLTDSVLNQSATLQADGDINIYSKQITNQRQQFALQQQITSQNFTVPITPWSGYYKASRTYTETTEQTVAAADSGAAQILAGKNMVLKGTITNDASTITAGGSIDFDVNALRNVSYGNTKTVTDSGTDYQTYSEEYCSRRILGHCIAHDWRDVTRTKSYYNQTSQAIPGWDAVFSANQSITGKAVTIDNISVQPPNAPVGSTAATLNAGQVGTSTSVDPVNRAGDPSLEVPHNGLYTVSSDPASHYLIETNSQFTNQATFMSSDYMLQRLMLDPATAQKRLGDGFYEEKLVRDQITQLTGRMYLGGYSSMDTEYKALMENGVNYAQQFNLQVGVALTSQQMSQLTTDMVWLVEKEVQGQKVLVPVVYLAHTQSGDLKADGSLIAAKDIQIVASGDLTNMGMIKADNSLQVSAANVVNRGGTIDGGNLAQITAGQDIANQSGTITGTQVALTAGRDITNETVVSGVNFGNLSTTLVNQQANISAQGSLTVQAGRDIKVTGANLTAGQDLVLNAGQNLQVGSQAANERIATGYYTYDTTKNITSSLQAGGSATLVAQKDATLSGAQVKAGTDLTLAAGGNINLAAVKDHTLQDVQTGNAAHGDYFHQRNDDETVIGSTLQGGGNVTVAAVNLGKPGVDNANRGNVTMVGSNLTSQNGTVNVAADQAITVQDVSEKHESLTETRKVDEGFLSTKTTETRNYALDNQVKGSTISGDKVNIESGKDLTVKGSNIVGTGDVNLTAQNNVNITTAQETGQTESYSYTKTSGIFGGGFGFTIGSRSQKLDTTGQTVTQIGSTVGSTNGQVNITSGQDTHITGSDIIGAQGIHLTGQNVTIDAAQNTSQIQQTYEFKQSGLSVSVGNSTIDALTSGASDVSRSRDVQDSRLKALYEYKAVEDAKPGLQAIQQNGVKAVTGGLSVTVSLGSSSTKSVTASQAATAQGSTLTSDKDITITATGSGAKDVSGKATDGNLNVIGSTLTGENITLNAAKDVNLQSADNVSQNNTTENSSSSGIGVKLSPSGPGFFVQGSKASDNAKENGTTHTGTQVTASNTLTINSGNDTNITGSQAKGDTVKVNVGGNLNLASQQDTDTYTERSNSAGGTLGIGMPSTISASKGKTDSNYQSVTQQSGIYAGKGGFDIQVGKNTDLKGAVISSEATPDKNKLSTDTLTYSDINNKADYSASSTGINVDTTTTIKDGKDANGKQTFVSEKSLSASPDISTPVTGSASSTTKSGISQGTIEVRSGNTDLSNLNRNTTDSLNALGKIFDKKTVQEKQELTKVFGQEAYKAIGDLALAQYKKALEDADKAKKAGNTKAYDEAMARADSWHDGGANKILLHAVAGGIMSSLGGGSFASGATSAGLNEAVQNELAKIKDPGLHQLASAAIGAAASKLAGGNAQTGASVAASATKNNWLDHYQQQDMAKALAAAGNDKEKRREIYAFYAALSQYNEDHYFTRDEAIEQPLLDQLHYDTADTKGGLNLTLNEITGYYQGYDFANYYRDRLENSNGVYIPSFLDHYDYSQGRRSDTQDNFNPSSGIKNQTPTERTTSVLNQGGTWDSSGQLLDSNGNPVANSLNRGDYAYSQEGAAIVGHYPDGTATVRIDGKDYPVYNVPKASDNSGNATTTQPATGQNIFGISDYNQGRIFALNPLSAFSTRQDINNHSEDFIQGFNYQNNLMYTFAPPKYISSIANGTMQGLMDGYSGPPMGPSLAPAGSSSSYTFTSVPLVGTYQNPNIMYAQSGDNNQTSQQNTNSSTTQGSGATNLETNPFNNSGTLKPNIKYQSGEYGYSYQTDEMGRISKFETDNLQLTDRTERLDHNPNTPGKLDGDHAGHLAGDRFGGSPELDNLVSQSSNVNLSEYKKIENQWAKAIEEGKQVKVNVEVNYEGSSLRPSKFNVQYEIDGKFYEKSILN